MIGWCSGSALIGYFFWLLVAMDCRNSGIAYSLEYLCSGFVALQSKVLRLRTTCGHG